VFTLAVLHRLLERAALFDEQSADAWTVVWEVLAIGKRFFPTTKAMLNRRGGTTIKVSASLTEPSTIELILSKTCEGTTSLQENEKTSEALEVTIKGRGMLLNTTEDSKLPRGVGKFKTNMLTLLLPAMQVPLTSPLSSFIAGKKLRMNVSVVMFDETNTV